jgi:hypothetical protein
MRGQPTLYTAEIADKIIEGLRGGRPLLAICRDDGMPSHVTVMNWVHQDRDGFAARYHDARAHGCPAADGRPTCYSSEIAERLCEELAAGRTVTEVCRDPDMPSARTVYNWAARNHSGFARIYRQAREAGCYAMADQVIDIADDASGDLIVREARDGSTVMVPNPENIKRAQLRGGSRRWLIAKFLPKQFGDKPEPGVVDPSSDALTLVMKLIDGQSRGLPKDDRKFFSLKFDKDAESDDDAA